MIINPRMLSGTVYAPLSKSCLHRALLCAALADGRSQISFGELDGKRLSEDVDATLDCLNALGCVCTPSENGISVSGSAQAPRTAVLPCRESGSTLRFLLPMAGALGVEADFTAAGRLPQRPLSPLREQLCAHGLTLSDSFPLKVRGQLRPGAYELRGDVSSQFISGLLFALPLLDGDSTLRITGKCESAPYIALTRAVMRQYGVDTLCTQEGYLIPGKQRYRSRTYLAEGDWSGGAFLLAAGALGGGPVTVRGLDLNSAQGDRKILDLLTAFGADVTILDGTVTVRSRPLHAITVDAAEIPDLVPVIAAVACAAQGTTVIGGAARLRLKESDRLAALQKSLGGLGADIRQTEDGLHITGAPQLAGGTADSFGDHRIAMAVAVVSAVCRQPVTLLNAGAVRKSYPAFFEDFRALNGDAASIETEEA